MFSYFENICRIPFESTIRLSRNSIAKQLEPELWNKSIQPVTPFSDYITIDMKVIFVYGVDFPRPSKTLIALNFWGSVSSWILFNAFFVGTIILFILIRQTRLQGQSFMYCLFEMYCCVIGNGNVRIQNGLEKLFYSAAFGTAFFFVAIYLADYSMHSLLDHRVKVDSFEELAKLDVPFLINAFFAEQTNYITNMLR